MIQIFYMTEIFYGGEFHAAMGYADASRQFREYLDSNDMGASDMKRNDGKIRVDGRPAGVVSYNGRVWDLQGKEVS